MSQQLTIHFFVQSVHKQGTYFRFHNWALGLLKHGHIVRVYGGIYRKGEKSRMELIDGIEYHITACYFPLQGKFGQVTHPWAGIRRLLKKYPPCDVAHVFQPQISAYLPWFFNKNKAKINLFDWDDLWTNGLVKQEKGFYNSWVYKQVQQIESKGPETADVTTACSHFLADESKKKGAKIIEIVYNGYWSYTPNNKIVCRNALGLKTDAFYIGFMGRTTQEIEWCVNLLKHVVPIYPNVRLALCGMPKHVIPYDIDKQINQSIDYLGLLPPLVTRDFASGIDIGLLPLEDEQFNQSRFPIKFAEYLAAGSPILCSQVGECAAIAKQFSFVKIAGKGHEDWMKYGLEMITDVMNKNWPAVNEVQLKSLLSWETISDKLNSVYMKELNKDD